MDVSCLMCGYNFRGLGPDGACPEGGTAIERARRGDLLCYCTPDWVGRLAQGTGWILVSLLLSVIYVLAVVVGRSSTGRKLDPLTVQVGALVPTLVGLVGYWLLTTPEPARVGNEPIVSARSLTRWCQVHAVLLGGAAIFAHLSSASLGELLDTIQSLIGLVGLFALFVYVRRLAERVPDQQLADHTRLVMWGWAAMIVLALCTGLAAGLGEGALLISGCFTTVLALIVLIWSLVLLFQYHNRFRAVAADARAVWGQSPTDT
jgi:hypothetical protein